MEETEVEKKKLPHEKPKTKIRKKTTTTFNAPKCCEKMKARMHVFQSNNKLTDICTSNTLITHAKDTDNKQNFYSKCKHSVPMRGQTKNKRTSYTVTI